MMKYEFNVNFISNLANQDISPAQQEDIFNLLTPIVQTIFPENPLPTPGRMIR